MKVRNYPCKVTVDYPGTDKPTCLRLGLEFIPRIGDYIEIPLWDDDEDILLVSGVAVLYSPGGKVLEVTIYCESGNHGKI